jgi:hypothetical protein
MTLSRPMIPDSEGALELVPVVLVFLVDDVPAEVLRVAVVEAPPCAAGAI